MTSISYYYILLERFPSSAFISEFAKNHNLIQLRKHKAIESICSIVKVLQITSFLLAVQ